MSDKYLNIDLNDPRSAAIADVMGNKTCKKIIELLAEKEMSESDIASELNLPLNTIGYNIAKLLKAGLVEKSKTFFWSVKGKKIPTYRLSNKKILISPKKLFSSMPLAFIGAIVGVVLILALMANLVNNEFFGKDNNFISDGSLKQFSTYEELETYIKNNANTGRLSGLDYLADATSMRSESANSGASPGVKSADSYSQTNIQVQGVDEPDFVKNDGKYIYVISGNTLYLLDAYPASDMKVISNITLQDNAVNMFVNGNKLIVFSNRYSYSNSEPGIVEKAIDMILPCYGYGCGGYSQAKTGVYVYDITDKESPEMESNYSFDGSYSDARMIGDNVYLISQQYLYGFGAERLIYSVNSVEKEIAVDDIYYSDIYDNNFAFTYVSAIDLSNKNVESKAYLLGTSGTIYISENNIYLTGQKQMSYKNMTEMRILDGIMPVMPSDYQEEIEEIMQSDEDIYQKEQRVMAIVYSYSNNLGKGDAGSEFNKALAKSIEDVEIKISKEYEKTVIHKIKIDGLEINYVSSGEVPGILLNQFSLDEYEGNLRVAVTTGNWRVESLNHLYVLNENLEIVGSVQDLASGERIYSARFMGERAYMVTFRQVDPLYVLDLSNPEEPEVLGYLKITGYSSYLHPYDENHLIGIGMEANEEGRVSGIKIALFDVSDVSAPKESAKYEIKNEGGQMWSSSSALYEHKAFLFDREKNLLVVPVEYSYYLGNNYNSWHGAYVFDITADSISLKGKVTHSEPYVPKYPSARDSPIGDEREDGYGNIWEKVAEDVWQSDKYQNFPEGEYRIMLYEPTWYNQSNEWIDSLPGGVNYQSYDYGWQKRIQRSLYMDSVLYTVSLGMVKANDLSDLSEISKVDLKYSEIYYPIYY